MLENRLKDDEVRLVLRRNDVMEARPGAFIFSAQALKVRLIDNRFGKACDCNLVEWTADLTQVKRHAHNHRNHCIPFIYFLRLSYYY